jgi:DNA-directed RNA polymerase subunit RPC12/RpoP
MIFKCKECGKEFKGEDCFSQFFAEPIQEPAPGMCEDCTRRMLEEVERQGIGKDELDAEVEKETTDCIL